MGRSKKIYNPEHSKIAQALSQYGITQEDIATHLGMCVETLVRLYRKELDDGRINANAKVGKSLFDKATGGDVTAMIFWAKTRMGWKETSKVEHSGSISWEEAIRKARSGNGNEAD